MNTAVILLALAASLVAGEDVSVVKGTICPGTQTTVRCLDGKQMVSFNASVYTSHFDTSRCRADEDLSTSWALCMDEFHSTGKGGLAQSLKSRCANRKECFIHVPSQLYYLKECSGRAFFYGLQVEIECAVVTGKTKTSSKIYRRQAHQSNSREQPTRQRDVSLNHNVHSNSRQHGQSDRFQSTETRRVNDFKSNDLYKSTETNGFNSVESKNSKDYSKNSDSNEYGRSGRRKDRRGKSYGGVYSGVGSQIGSSAVRVSAVVSSVALAVLAAVLY